MTARISASGRSRVLALREASRMAGTPVSSCVRIPVPIADFSPDHDVLRSFPTVTTSSATSTWATPGSANNRSARGDPAARSRSSKKKGPPGCTVRHTVILHASGSASEVSARIVIVGSTGRTSDIFHDLGCVELTEGPQVLEGVDPGAVAVVPAEPDGVVTDAGDLAWGYIRSHTLRIQERPPAGLLDADGTVARQSEVPDVEVVAAPILPEYGQRPRISPAEADRGCPRARWPNGALHPGRLALLGFPSPHKCP